MKNAEWQRRAASITRLAAQWSAGSFDLAPPDKDAKLDMIDRYIAEMRQQLDWLAAEARR